MTERVAEKSAENGKSKKYINLSKSKEDNIMLKKILSTVLSVSVASMMLAGMYTIPASAKTKEYQDVSVTKTIINETFDKCTADAAFGANAKPNPVSVTNADENTTVQVYESWGTTPLTIKDGTASMDFGSGAKLNIKNSSGTTQVKKGDIIKVSFKVKNNESTASSFAPLIINLNDHKKTSLTDSSGTMSRYTPKEATTSWAKGYEYPRVTDSNADNNDKCFDGRILHLNPSWSEGGHYGLCAAKDWNAQMSKMSKTEWNNVTITINTADTDYEEQQTLKAEVSYTDKGTEKSTFIKGLYDADYKGDSSDTTYDEITSIDSIQIDSLKSLAGINYIFDDIKVELKTTERRLTSVKSDLDGTIINETFDKCTADAAFGANAKMNPVPVTNADENTTVQVYESWGTTPLTIKDGAASMNFGNGAKLNIKNKSGSTPVKEGDIVKISFKVKDTSVVNGRLMVNLNNNKNNGKTDDNGKMSRYTAKEGKTTDDATYTKASVDYPYWVASGEPYKDGRVLNMNVGKHSYSMTSKNDYDPYVAGHKVGTDVWTDVTITINTKDAAYENQQTIKAEASYTDSATNQTVSTYFKGLYDADYKGDSNDTTYDRITSIDSIQLDSYTYYVKDVTEDGVNKQYHATADFDDIKVQVISPAFEIWGDATTVDFVDGVLDDEFIQGRNLTVKASAANNNATLLVGVYDENGRLISCTTAKAAENSNIITASSISTTGADTIKLFLWDDASITPYIESKTLTKYAGSESLTDN